MDVLLSNEYRYTHNELPYLLSMCTHLLFIPIELDPTWTYTKTEFTQTHTRTHTYIHTHHRVYWHIYMQFFPQPTSCTRTIYVTSINKSPTSGGLPEVKKHSLRKTHTKEHFKRSCTIAFFFLIQSQPTWEPRWSSGYTFRLSSGKPGFDARSWLPHHSSFHCIYPLYSSSSDGWGLKMAF